MNSYIVMFIQGQNLSLTVLYVPYSLNSGTITVSRVKP